MRDPVVMFDLSGIHQNYEEEESYFRDLVSNFRWLPHSRACQGVRFVSSEDITHLFDKMNLDLSRLDYVLLPLWGATIFNELLISHNIKKIYAPVSTHPSVTISMEGRKTVQNILNEYSAYKRSWAEQVRELFGSQDHISVLILDEIHDTGATMNGLEWHLRRLCPHQELKVERAALFHVRRAGKAPPEYFAVDYELPKGMGTKGRLIIQKASHLFFQFLPRSERKELENMCGKVGLNFDFDMRPDLYSYGNYTRIFSFLQSINHDLISLEEMKEKYFKIPR